MNHNSNINERFWTRKIGEGQTESGILTEFDRKPFRLYIRQDYELDLSLEKSGLLRSKAAARQGSLFGFFFAALYTWVAKFTYSQDIVLGTIINSGKFPGGNLVPVKCGSSCDQSSLGILSQVENALNETVAHGTLSYQEILKMTGHVNDTSVAPIFQIMIVAQGLGESPGNPFDCNAQAVEMWQEEIRSRDIVLHLDASANKISLKWEFDATLWREETIALFAKYYIENLDRLISSDDGKTLEKDVELTAVGGIFPNDRTFISLFEEQVTKTGDAIAVHSGDVQVSYRKLNELAENVAARLSTHALDPEAVVAVLLPRDITYLATIVGIFKAGYVYLPLDVRDPGHRQVKILKQVDAKVLVTEKCAIDGLDVETIRDIKILSGRNLVGPTELAKASGARVLDMKNLAYIIFTSGSTGTPKGVHD